MNPEFVAFLVAVPLGIAAALVLGAARRRRRDRVRAWAEAAGHTFREEDDGLEHRFRGFEPFGKGTSRRVRHVVTGHRGGHRFLAFQYEHTTGGGKDRKRHVHTVCVLRTPVSSPGLSLRRERLHHRVLDTLGGEDIDFESDAFSRLYWVKGTDRRFAYDVLHPRMMEYLMPHAGYVWQWRGGDLMLHVAGPIEPERVEAMVDVCGGMVALLPRHLHPTVS